MPLRQGALAEPGLWAALYAQAFGPISEQPQPHAFCSLVGLDERGAQEWLDGFTGWYPGVFDETDGYLDDPATVQFALAGGMKLRVEFHPCGTYWFLTDMEGVDTELAELSGHWRLPGLRWQEAVASGRAAPADNALVVLLLLPIVWLTAGEDAGAARSAAELAWTNSGLVSGQSASALAELWAQEASYGSDYAWRPTPAGWACSAEWSTRGDGTDAGAAALVNHLVRAASGE